MIPQDNPRIVLGFFSRIKLSVYVSRSHRSFCLAQLDQDLAVQLQMADEISSHEAETFRWKPMFF